MKRIVVAALLVATLPHTAFAGREFYPRDNAASQPRHLRFTTPQGKTCADKCRFHVGQTHENFNACMRRHCSTGSLEHW